MTATPTPDPLRTALEAFVKAGGANPAMGMVRFSFWRLDRLQRAFDLAVEALRESETPLDR